MPQPTHLAPYLQDYEGYMELRENLHTTLRSWRIAATPKASLCYRPFRFKMVLEPPAWRSLSGTLAIRIADAIWREIKMISLSKFVALKRRYHHACPGEKVYPALQV